MGACSDRGAAWSKGADMGCSNLVCENFPALVGWVGQPHKHALQSPADFSLNLSGTP